jgi:type I restriction enzyme, S subunit
MEAIDITPEQRRTILTLLKRYLPGVQVWAFGSRVKWTSRPESDLDLAVFTTAEQKSAVSALKQALEESDIPFRVDVLVWDELPEKFQKKIHEEHVSFAAKLAKREKPDGWRIVRLRDVARVQSGFAFKSSDMGTIGAPIVKIKNIQPPLVNVTDVQRVPFEVVRNNSRIKQFELERGDILIAMTGATVGKVGRMPATHEICYLNQRVGKVFLTKPEMADYNYLYYVLSQDTHIQQMFGIADGSAQANISPSQIENLEVILPPLPTQHTIARILGLLDDLIDLNWQTNETLEQIARALFNHYFPYSPDDDLPEGWRVGKVGDLGDVVCGKTPPAANSENYGKDVPFITIPDMHGKIFVTQTGKMLSHKGASTQPSKTLPAFSICVSCIATPGLVAITSKESQTNQQINSLIPKHEYGSFYCYYVMREMAGAIRAHGSSGSLVLNVNKGQFSSMRVILPPEEVMESFQCEVESLFHLILASNEQVHTLASLRDLLLPKLMSGEIRALVEYAE